jgi:hypothetical protein
MDGFYASFYKSKKINKIIGRYDEVYGISIGNFIKGRYRSPNGNLYDEISLGAEIIGINSETLNSVAEDFAKEFELGRNCRKHEWRLQIRLL